MGSHRANPTGSPTPKKLIEQLSRGEITEEQMRLIVHIWTNNKDLAMRRIWRIYDKAEDLRLTRARELWTFRKTMRELFSQRLPKAAIEAAARHASARSCLNWDLDVIPVLNAEARYVMRGKLNVGR